MSTLKFFFRACDVLSDPFTNWINNKNVCMEKDIIYDNNNPDILKADFYYTQLKKNTKYPIFINIHGGGFVAGDKRFRRGFAITIAREGFFVININYGLCPEHKFPYFIENTITAIKWACENAEKYNLDTNNIFLSGDSSGSFIAAITAGALTNKDFANSIKVSITNISIKAILLYCGIYDFLSICYNNNNYFKKNIDYAKIITGMDEKELEEIGFLELVSPNCYISKNYPPTFITYSTKDILCNGFSNVLIDNLKEKNIEHQIFAARNIEDIHCFHLRPLIKNARKCIKASASFLEEQLAENK